MTVHTLLDGETSGGDFASGAVTLPAGSRRIVSIDAYLDPDDSTRPAKAILMAGLATGSAGVPLAYRWFNAAGKLRTSVFVDETDPWSAVTLVLSPYTLPAGLRVWGRIENVIDADVSIWLEDGA